MEAGPAPGLDEATLTPAATKFVEVRSAQPQHLIKRAISGFVRSPAGRDSLLRTLQYTLRLVLLYRVRYKPSKPSFRPSRTVQSCFAIVSLLSALRRLLALHTLLQSLASISQRSISFAPSRAKRRQTWTDYLAQLMRNLLDLVAVVMDNLYLGSRLGVISPRFIDSRQAKRIDQWSDFATLGSIVIGLYQVEPRSKHLRAKGNETRLKAVKLEHDLEEADIRRQEREITSQIEVEEERSAREQVRAQRSKLRKIREEIARLKWEKCRLGAEGIFALYDALDLQIGREIAKGWSGATASLIEASQAWSEYMRA